MDLDQNGAVDMQEFKAFLLAEKNKNTQTMLVSAMRQDKKNMTLDEFRSFFLGLLRIKYSEIQLEGILNEMIKSHEKPVVEEIMQAATASAVLDNIPLENEEFKKEETVPPCASTLHIDFDDAASGSSFYLIGAIASPSNQTEITKCGAIERALKDFEHQMIQLKTIDIPKVEQDMADQLYQESAKQTILATLDQEITGHMDLLNQIKLKNQKTEIKLPKDNQPLLDLVNMVADMEILKAKKEKAGKACFDRYLIHEE